jgi:hypothetical protein
MKKACEHVCLSFYVRSRPCDYNTPLLGEGFEVKSDLRDRVKPMEVVTVFCDLDHKTRLRRPILVESITLPQDPHAPRKVDPRNRLRARTETKGEEAILNRTTGLVRTCPNRIYWASWDA